MSTLYFRFGGLPTGLTLKATLRDHAATDSYWKQSTTSWQAAAPVFADAAITLTEESGNYLGTYVGTADVGTYSSAVPLTVYIHNNASPTTPLMSVDFGVQAGEEISTPYLNQSVLDVFTRIGAPAGASVSADIANLDTDVATVDTVVDGIATQIGVAGLGLSAIPKTGYKLASDGLDSVAITAPSGVASNFREMLVAVWRRFFKKCEYSDTANTLKTFADDGTTVVTTQTATNSAGVQTTGAAT